MTLFPIVFGKSEQNETRSPLVNTGKIRGL